MVDMTMIAEAVSSLKTASEIAKTLVGLKDGQALQSKVAELNGIILSAQSSALAAQSSQFTLLQRVSELEKDIARFEAWSTEKQRYELKELGSSFAYAVKEVSRNGEPAHKICAACYQHGTKSILQLAPQSVVHTKPRDWFCPECKTNFST
jgi:hypothetical protein